VQAPVHFGGGHDDQAEVTMPPGELGKTPPAGGREVHRLDELVVVQAGLQRAGEQVRGRDLAPAIRTRDARDRTGRGGYDGEFGGRVGVRQAAAEGAAGADGRVADPAGGLGQQRVPVLRGERAVPGQGADPQPAAGPGDEAVQPGDAVDVDEHARLGQPQRQQRHQALAARDDLALALVVGLRQPRHGVLDAVRSHVVEGSRFHLATVPGTAADASRRGRAGPRRRPH